MFGWPDDKAIQDLRTAFAKETDPAKQKAIVEQLQARAREYPTHIHLGQWYQPSAMRKNVDGVISAPAPVFWNVTLKK